MSLLIGTLLYVDGRRPAEQDLERGQQGLGPYGQLYVICIAGDGTHDEARRRYLEAAARRTAERHGGRYAILLKAVEVVERSGLLCERGRRDQKYYECQDSE